MLLQFVRRHRWHFGSMNPTKYTRQHRGEMDERNNQKPYLKLFRETDMDVGIPEESVLKGMRGRRIAQVIANNHALKDDNNRLLAHIVCLHGLLDRTEPSIEAISMFIECFFQEFKDLGNRNIDSYPSMRVLLNPSIMTKLVSIANSIDSFYNQSLRMMISTAIIKAIKSIQDPQRTKADKTESKSPVLTDKDYWNGMYYLLTHGYYEQKVLSNAVKKLVSALKTGPCDCLKVVSLQLKCLVQLQKFKWLDVTSGKQFKEVYCYLMDHYLKILSNHNELFLLLQAPETVIQTGLLFQFLPISYHGQEGGGYQQAKEIYISLFSKIFDFAENGSLLMEVRQLQGIFEVLLLMCNHDDTNKIHSLLAQLEKAMSIYTFSEIRSLETHMYLCQHYGYRSDFFAELLEQHLSKQQQRFDSIRGHMHPAHQASHAIRLARKFLVCSQIVDTAQDISERCQGLASKLFDGNVWHLVDKERNRDSLLNGFSLESQLYFFKARIFNLLGRNGRTIQRIRQLAKWNGVINVDNRHQNFFEGLENQNLNQKLSHGTLWKDNSNARLIIIIQLGINHYRTLQVKHYKDARAFLLKFIEKILNIMLSFSSNVETQQSEEALPEKSMVLVEKMSYPGMLPALQSLLGLASNQKLGWLPQFREARLTFFDELKKYMGEKEGGKQVWKHNPLYQPYLQTIELNRVMIPFNNQVYCPSMIGKLSRTDPILWISHHNFEMAKYIETKINTMTKYQNGAPFNSVYRNYIHYPYLADFMIYPNGKSKPPTAVILQVDPKNNPNPYFQKYPKEASQYFKAANKPVEVLKNQREVDEFIDKRLQKI